MLQPQKIQTGHRRVRRLPAANLVEWAALWSLSLGVAANAMAAIVYFVARDVTGAAFILGGTAAFVAQMMRVSAPPQG